MLRLVEGDGDGLAGKQASREHARTDIARSWIVYGHARGVDAPEGVAPAFAGQHRGVLQIVPFAARSGMPVPTTMSAPQPASSFRQSLRGFSYGFLS